MNIVFIGCVEFSEYCLKVILKCNGNVVGVVTSHDSGLNSDYVDLSVIAKKMDIPVYSSADINDKLTLAWVKSLSPDIIFCFGWSQLIKRELLSLSPMGVLGAHPTQLPMNRGRHPVIWALVLGLKETALTFFFMNDMADAGPILFQEKIIISNEETARSLYDKIKYVASIAIPEFLPSLIKKSYVLVEQKPEIANSWRKRSRADGVIDWRMSAVAISNLVRALTFPYPGAEFMHKNKIIKVWSVAIVQAENARGVEPGKVIRVSGSIPCIKCQEGIIKLLEYEPRVTLSVGDYL